MVVVALRQLFKIVLSSNISSAQYRDCSYRVAQNSKKVENYIFPHCLRYPILFQVICNKNQLHSFKIGASQATPNYTKDFPENTKENSESQYFEKFS